MVRAWFNITVLKPTSVIQTLTDCVMNSGLLIERINLGIPYALDQHIYDDVKGLEVFLRGFIQDKLKSVVFLAPTIIGHRCHTDLTNRICNRCPLRMININLADFK